LESKELVTLEIYRSTIKESSSNFIGWYKILLESFHKKRTRLLLCCYLSAPYF
jgi:hypothetical protein